MPVADIADRLNFGTTSYFVLTFSKAEGLLYVRNDDSQRAKHDEPPVVVNYFFHEEIIPSARKEHLRKTRVCC